MIDVSDEIQTLKKQRNKKKMKEENKGNRLANMKCVLNKEYPYNPSKPFVGTLINKLNRKNTR